MKHPLFFAIAVAVELTLAAFQMSAESPTGIKWDIRTMPNRIALMQDGNVTYPIVGYILSAKCLGRELGSGSYDVRYCTTIPAYRFTLYYQTADGTRQVATLLAERRKDYGWTWAEFSIGDVQIERATVEVVRAEAQWEFVPNARPETAKLDEAPKP
ncbi:MAG: hypothetical protein ACKV22_19140 [Bryobacteraceae bacterium]